MNMDPELAGLTARLAEVAARNTAASVATRIDTLRTAKQDRNTINELEEIVNDLIGERAEIMGIAQAYEEQLVAQRISDEDIDFITGELVPKLKEIFAELGQTSDADEIEKVIGPIEMLLSKELLRVLQALGFNFKQAIGEPLTDLVAQAIRSKSPFVPADPDTHARISLEHQTAFARLSENPDAYQRFVSLFGSGAK